MNPYSEEAKLSREREVIRAMQWRQRRWISWFPGLGLLWRKPWKSPAPMAISIRIDTATNVHNLVQWLRNAHDCSDPSIGCSCQGGYRFPSVPVQHEE